MSSRASESVSVGTFWNSPSLRSVVASSSPVAFSREREVGTVEAMIGGRSERGGIYGTEVEEDSSQLDVVEGLQGSKCKLKREKVL